jgi:hypothetical protein
MTYEAPFRRGLIALMSTLRSPSEIRVWDGGGGGGFAEGLGLTEAEEAIVGGGWWWLGAKGHQRGP